MPKTRQQKEKLVVEITDKLNRSKSLVFADYQGLTMGQLLDLRQKLADAGAEFNVTKNNLLQIALKDAGIEITDGSFFSGPVATLFSYEDEVGGIKILTKSLKDYQMGSIKGGYLNGEILDQYKITKIASLPTRDELRAKTVGALGSPLYGIVGVLQANLRNLVYVLDQIKAVRGGE